MTATGFEAAGFELVDADYAAEHMLLHGLRRRVFVEEQGVDASLETDVLDPVSDHVLALDAAGTAIGTGRLTPDGRLGRMAVAGGWRSRGVGAAMLLRLIERARLRGLASIVLHAQLPARDFYARHGFLPEGEEFVEAGIVHQQMRLTLSGAVSIDSRGQALAITTTLIHRARRRLLIHTRQLDPGLLDAAPVLHALRRFATARHEKQALLLVHDAAAILAGGPPLLALIQRLPSAFRVREVADPVDRARSSACLVNDQGDYYFRLIGHRHEGEAGLQQPARSRQFEDDLQRVWERSRECSELRALGA